MGELKRLFLVRHCESRYIASGEASVDSPLSDDGLADAERLSERLASEKCDVALTSLMVRARQTAAAIVPSGIPVFANPALNEYPLDDEGKGIESTSSGLSRSMGFLYRYSPYFESVMVVAHNSILTTMLCATLNAPWPRGHGPAFETPGTVRVLEFDWERGDTVWNEVAAFEPSGNSLRPWFEVVANAPR